MKPCHYCGSPMPNARRVQCGAPACKRAHKATYMRQWQREHKAKTGSWWNSGPRRNIHTRVCVHCGVTWKTASKAAKFCSFTCQAAHQHGDGRKRRMTSAQKRRAVARRRLARAARGSSGRTPWVTGRCSECGAGFATSLPLARTCSATCAQVRRRKRHGKYVDDDTRLAIYERDGWTCQLCFEPVDPTLHYLDDWAASLDHIVCRSWSEEPDHSPENLRLAHRWCNSVRGDESHYGTAMLAAA